MAKAELDHGQWLRLLGSKTEPGRLPFHRWIAQKLMAVARDTFSVTTASRHRFSATRSARCYGLRGFGIVPRRPERRLHLVEGVGYSAVGTVRPPLLPGRVVHAEDAGGRVADPGRGRGGLGRGEKDASSASCGAAADHRAAVTAADCSPPAGYPAEPPGCLRSSPPCGNPRKRMRTTAGRPQARRWCERAALACGIRGRSEGLGS